MTLATANGTACAKAILLGEHSVVYGEPAISAAIDLRLRVRLRARSGDEPRAPNAAVETALVRALRSFRLERLDLVLEIDSEIPIASGLGSSAAISVALLRAVSDLAGIALDPFEIARRATEIENVFHGTSSGIDVATVASGGVIWFQRGAAVPFRPLALGSPFEIVIALSGERRSTAEPVRRLRERYGEHPDLYRELFHTAGRLADFGRSALEAGDLDALGRAMDSAHGLLNAFGVSTPTLEHMIHVARRAGALGAKLTGAGGGGAILALAAGDAGVIAAELRAEGFETLVTGVRGNPLEEVRHVVVG